MLDNKTNIDYSFQDIQRYLNNGMNVEEMRALEKAALNDPFLSDAIEGFSTLPGITADNHINQINAALEGEHGKAKLIPLAEKKFYWWRIAAMVVIVAGLGTLGFYIINNNNSTTEQKNVLANNNLKEKTTDNIVVQDSPLLNNQDSVFIAQNDMPVQKLKNLEPQHIIISQNKQENAREIAASQFSFSTDDSFSLQKPVFAYTPGVAPADATDYKKTDSLKDALHLEKALQGRVSGLYFNKANSQVFNFFNGQIADNNNLPIANAVIMADKKQATVTDKNGYFKITSADSVLNVMVSSVGFNSVNASLNANGGNVIKLTPATENLSDVVVTGYGSLRKAGNSFADSAHPVGGWQSFLQYMDTTLNREIDSSDTDERLDLESADYIVEFLIDANGNPYSFRIPKNMNPAMRSRVIEMIKEGPRWVPAQNSNKAKLKIPR